MAAVPGRGLNKLLHSLKKDQMYPRPAKSTLHGHSHCQLHSSGQKPVMQVKDKRDLLYYRIDLPMGNLSN